MSDFVLRIPLKTYLSIETLTEKGVYMAIYSFTDNGQGICWASQREIAKRAGCNQSTVKRILPKLITDGFLKVSGSRSVKGGKVLELKCCTTHQLEDEVMQDASVNGLSDAPRIESDAQCPTKQLKETNIYKGKPKKVELTQSKQKKQPLEEKEITEWLGKYNSKFDKAYRGTVGLLPNYKFWRQSYSQTEMLESLEYLPSHNWLKDKHKPDLILRQRDTKGQPVDRIGELLSLKSSRETINYNEAKERGLI